MATELRRLPSWGCAGVVFVVIVVVAPRRLIVRLVVVRVLVAVHVRVAAVAARQWERGRRHSLAMNFLVFTMILLHTRDDHRRVRRPCTMVNPAASPRLAPSGGSRGRPALTNMRSSSLLTTTWSLCWGPTSCPLMDGASDRRLELHLGHMWVGPRRRRLRGAARRQPLGASFPPRDGRPRARRHARRARRRAQGQPAAAHAADGDAPPKRFFEVGRHRGRRLRRGWPGNRDDAQLGLGQPYSKHPLDAIAIEASLSKIHDHLEHNRHHERRRRYDDRTAATGAPNRHHDHHRADGPLRMRRQDGNLRGDGREREVGAPPGGQPPDRDDDAAVSGVWVPKGGRLPARRRAAAERGGRRRRRRRRQLGARDGCAAFHGESECWHCVLPFKGHR